MKILKYFTILFFVIFIPVLVNALDYPSINSKIVEIYDLTDKKVIYTIDENKKASIASLTKIVTTITAIENIDNLDEKVTITKELLNTVRWDASRAGLKDGDILSYRDLLYASMLPSGADATNSLAILSSGSIDNFVKKMNELVEKLNLKNTHFVNVTGLDADNHYSSADDIRKILAYALDNVLFRKIYTTKNYTLSNGFKVKSTILTYNNNATIDTSKIIGSKTGYTLLAGYCLSSLSNINSHEFLIIVLNAEHKNNYYYNIVDTVNLIDFLLDNYNYQVLVKKKDIVKVLPVKLSNKDDYKIYSNKDITYYLPSDYDKNKINIEYKGLEELSFNNKVGEKIGSISYYYDDKLITKEEIILNDKLEVNIGKVVKEYYLLVILLLVVIIFIIVLIKRKKRKKKPKRKEK